MMYGTSRDAPLPARHTAPTGYSVRDNGPFAMLDKFATCADKGTYVDKLERDLGLGAISKDALTQYGDMLADSVYEGGRCDETRGVSCRKVLERSQQCKRIR